MTPSGVCAVVLTYNRAELLRECLGAILAQSRPPDHVLVVNNASTDGTARLLAEEFPGVEALHLPRNVGSAGGFHEGMRAATARGFGWLWIMDDDVLPRADALAELLGKAAQLGEVAFVCSKVVGVDGSSMNVPDVDERPGPNRYPAWEAHLDLGAVRVRRATFVSMLLPTSTVRACGLPLRDMYMFGEDTEYTMRVTRHLPGYLVGSSVATHKRALQAPLEVNSERDPVRLRYHYYRFRNDAYVKRTFFGPQKTVRMLAHHVLRLPGMLLRLGGARRALITARGLAAGLSFKPRPEPYADADGTDLEGAATANPADVAPGVPHEHVG